MSYGKLLVKPLSFQNHRRPAGRDDLRRHRHAGRVQPRGCQGIHRIPRRQSDGQCQQEHQLFDAGRSAGVETGKSESAGEKIIGENELRMLCGK